MNCVYIHIKGRYPKEASNKYLAEIYSNGPKFDIDLVAADQKIISAHKFILSMYSGYINDYLCEFKPKGRACIPLSQISPFVLQQAIDLIYNGFVMVGIEVKPSLINAVTILKIDNVTVKNPEQYANHLAHCEKFIASMAKVSTQRPLPAPVIAPAPNDFASEPSTSMSIPAKRQRAQSLYVERPTSGLISKGLTLPQVNAIPSRMGSITITKTKASPAPRPLPMDSQTTIVNPDNLDKNAIDGVLAA